MEGDPGPLNMAHAVAFVLCLLFSAFFSSAEFSLTTLSKIRLKEMVQEGLKNATKVEKLLNNTNKLTISLRLGGKFSQFGAMAISYLITTRFIAKDALAILVGTIITSIFLLIFCDIVPKNMAGQNSDKMSLLFATPVSLIVKISTPLVFLINIISGFFIHLMGGNKSKKLPIVTEAEIMTMVTMGQEEGILEDNEKKMISNVFSFGDYKARDVMVPRPDITCIDIDTTFTEVVEIFKEEGYSRLPIYEDTPDTIKGILYLRDIAFIKEDGFDIRRYMREPFYTYELKPTGELFSLMKGEGISMAVVLDEYGGTAGIITIEDFIEEIVGEIADEYDDIKNEIEIIKEDEYIVDGGTRLETVNEMIGVRLESEDFDSVGGFIMGTLGRMPEVGDELEVDEVKFKVESLAKNRVDKIRIYT